ncbi:chymotrypsin-like elastase family member 2A [Diabrotica virgifera virgifera]|uniref:chymotrypsin n=1 Tax=Diabrotica virgifera virgifera TaxID=50390 RepID=A0A6P7EZH3_DIAVI|nr:chymotrypsin-like elastase family member 2A [Diabrotica virgifera virgifera]
MKPIVLCLMIIAASKAIPTNRLTNDDANLGDFPWIVALNIYARMPWYEITYHECGGVLVSKSWVLTSASCVKSNAQWNTVTEIYAGFVRQNDPSRQSFTISRIERHPGFNMNESRNPSFDDIALVKLDRDVELNENVKIIKLPEADADITKNFTSAGWPYAAITRENQDILQLRSVPFLDYKTCYDQVAAYVALGRTEPLDEAWDNIYLNETQNICTGPKDAETAVFTKGYHGGPLIQDGVVYGVLSYTLNVYIYHKDFYEPSGVFINVFNYISWIKGIVDDL